MSVKYNKPHTIQAVIIIYTVKLNESERRRKT